MKNVAIYLPEIYLELLKELERKTGANRSELVRRAIKEHLEKNQQLLTLIKEVFPHIERDPIKRLENQLELKLQKEIELDKEKIANFFDYCIICDRKLHTKENYYKFKNIDIYELKFCCNCYDKFKISTLQELPKSLLTLVQKKLEAYKNRVKKS